MTPADAARVLAKCAAYDGRTIGEVDAMAWHEVLADIDLTDALTAVTRHYRDSAEWAMPAHIRRHALRAREDRLRREHVRSDVLSLPSRFETDEERDARIAARIAEVRAAVRKRHHAEPQPEPEHVGIDELRRLTDGPNWPEPANS